MPACLSLTSQSFLQCHKKYSFRRVRDISDIRIAPVKSGFNTVRLHWSKTGICSVSTLGASLGRIIFTVFIRKSEKLWKVLRDCLNNLPTGLPSGLQTFPRGCTPWESPMTFGNSLGQIFPDNPYGISTVCTTQPNLLHSAGRIGSLSFCGLLHIVCHQRHPALPLFGRAIQDNVWSNISILECITVTTYKITNCRNL